MSVTRVLLADDQALVRAGLRKIFEADSKLAVVGEVEDGVAVVPAVDRFDPDVVVMDIRMPTVDGLEATRRLAARDAERPRVLVLTTFNVDEYVFGALRAGAAGFLLKDSPPERLLEAVHVVARGEALLEPRVTRSVIERFANAPGRPDSLARIEELTEREREVLMLLASGFSNREIGEELVISEGTVKTHVNRVLAKLGVRDRVQAAIVGYEAGLARR